MNDCPPDSHNPEVTPDTDTREGNGLGGHAGTDREPAVVNRQTGTAELAEAPTRQICGVDERLIVQFLKLIRDYYKKADKATFFLEQRTGLVNVPGIANIRDVFSHLVTLLDPNTADDQREAQVENAAEHLRRAIVEPYEMALNELTAERFKNLYGRYKSSVIPVCARYPALNGAPNIVSVEARLREIETLAALGRAAKAENIWNPEWEKGVASFIEAFEKLSDLYQELEQHLNIYDQIMRDRKSTLINIASLAAGIGGFVLGIISFAFAVALILFPSLATTMRSLLGLG
jgi:hypothetical protein